MPELPEVETVRRSIEPLLVGRSIARVRVLRRGVIAAPGDPPGGFSRARSAGTPARFAKALLLEGDTLHSVDRHGKQLALVGLSGRAVGVHLGMTGALGLVAQPRRPLEPHAHVVWTLDNGARLVFVDPRRFGLVRLSPEGPAPLWATLGPDALSIRAPDLAARLAGTRRPVKAALLDQRVLAGVGNIYADEALHAARIRPTRLAGELREQESRDLARAIRAVLRGAIRGGGSSIRDYRDGLGRAGSYQASHAVYGRGGEPCLRCGEVLHRELVAQRTTVWCPRCQP